MCTTPFTADFATTFVVFIALFFHSSTQFKSLWSFFFVIPSEVSVHWNDLCVFVWENFFFSASSNFSSERIFLVWSSPDTTVQLSYLVAVCCWVPATRLMFTIVLLTPSSPHFSSHPAVAFHLMRLYELCLLRFSSVMFIFHYTFAQFQFCFAISSLAFPLLHASTLFAACSVYFRSAISLHCALI